MSPVVSPEPAPPTEAPERRRSAGPFLLAGLLLGLLVWRAEPARLFEQLRAGPHLVFFVYTFFAAALLTVLDAVATRATLSLCRSPRPLGELFLVRGALNLAGALHLMAVQVLMGLYLYRSGERPGRATALVVLLIVTQLGALLLLGVGGLVFPGALPASLLALYPAGIAGFVVVIATLPFWIGLARSHLPVVLAEKLAALAGFRSRTIFAATLVRLPHVVLLAVAPWGAFRVWGIDLPFWHGFLLMPTALLVSALPLTPAGFGTTQAAMVWLFAPLLAGPRLENEALVLSAALSWGTYGLLSQLLLGLLCLPFLPRDLLSGSRGRPSP